MMTPQLQRRVQRYGWDRAEPYYESGWSRQLAPAQNLLLEMAALHPGETVLDVACGTGLVTFRAADTVGSTGSVLGTDISDRMVESARNRAGANGRANVRFERMDADDLTVPEESFDVVLCALGLMYVPFPIETLSEMHRVTRRGGRVVVAVWGQRDRCGWAGIFPVVDARVETEVCPLFFQLGTGNALELALTAAGFGSVESQRIETILRYESGEDACKAAFAGGPVAMAYSRFNERTQQEAHADYLETIRPFRNGRGYEIPGEFVVGIGRRES